MKLAFVVPWFGKGVSGGAESVAAATVAQLKAAGYPVEVFTTCIQNFHGDWSKNYHRPGTATEDGVIVHRFPVEPRDKVAYDLINQKIIGRMRVTAEEQVTFANEMMKCPKLLETLYREKDNYLFFFIPYLFPTTFDGVNLVGRNSVMLPCFHDEGYAYLDTMKPMMSSVGAVVYHTYSEQKLTQQLYPISEDQIELVLGTGMSNAHAGDPKAFGQKYGIGTDYVLYVGRKGPGKNTPQLVSYWNNYQSRSGNAKYIKLVLIGPGPKNPVSLYDESSVVDLGFISAEDKRNAFAGATAFCHPSAKESFSLVLMEAWQAHKPVLVNGFSPVLVEHVKRSNGGLYYANEEEFMGMLDWLIDHPEESAQMGRNGADYVTEHFSRDVIMSKLIRLIDEMAAKHGLDIERISAESKQ